MQEVTFTILASLVVVGFSLPMDYDPDYPWVYSGEFEGDILLEPDQEGKHGIVDEKFRWPKGVMHYQFDKNITQEQRDIVMKAFDEYHAKTCLKIVPRTNQRNYVDIGSWKPDKCFSNLGMISGRQKLNLGGDSNCFKHGTILHELMHAFGFWHQHADPNRDEYITIVWENIKPGNSSIHQFKKYNSTVATDFGVGYDYGSVMHYPKNANSIDPKNLDTIIPKDPTAKIGQRLKLSDKDVLKLKKMYNC